MIPEDIAFLRFEHRPRNCKLYLIDKFFFEEPRILRQLIETYFVGTALQQHGSAAGVMDNIIDFFRGDYFIHTQIPVTLFSETSSPSKPAGTTRRPRQNLARSGVPGI